MGQPFSFLFLFFFLNPWEKHGVSVISRVHLGSRPLSICPLVRLRDRNERWALLANFSIEFVHICQACRHY